MIGQHDDGREQARAVRQVEHLADARHEHQHTHKAVHDRRDAGEQARRLASQHGLELRRRDLGEIHRRQKADGHAEDDRARRAVNTCQNKRQNAVLRLCRRRCPHLAEQERHEPDLPDGGDAGDDRDTRVMSSTHPTVMRPRSRNTPCTTSSEHCYLFCFISASSLYAQRRAVSQPPPYACLCLLSSPATAPAAEMMVAASAEVAKSKNFCAAALRAQCLPSSRGRTDAGRR